MSGKDNNNEYKFKVEADDEIIKITSSSLSLVKSAKIVLDDYFSHRSQQVVIARQPLFPDSTKEAIVKISDVGVNIVVIILPKQQPTKPTLSSPNRMVTYKTHCSKSSFFVQKFNFDFPRKL